MDQSLLRNIKSVLKSLIISSPRGVTVEQLNRDYREVEGCGIPYAKMGFSNLEQFLLSLNDTISVQGKGPTAVVCAITSEKTAHIEKLVAKQKKPPKTRKEEIMPRLSRIPDRSSYRNQVNVCKKNPRDSFRDYRQGNMYSPPDLFANPALFQAAFTNVCTNRYNNVNSLIPPTNYPYYPGAGLIQATVNDMVRSKFSMRLPPPQYLNRANVFEESHQRKNIFHKQHSNGLPARTYVPDMNNFSSNKTPRNFATKQNDNQKFWNIQSNDSGNVQSDSMSREQEKITDLATNQNDNLKFTNIQSPDSGNIQSDSTSREKEKIANIDTEQNDNQEFWNAQNHDLEKLQSDTISKEKVKITNLPTKPNEIKDFWNIQSRDLEEIQSDSGSREKHKIVSFPTKKNEIEEFWDIKSHHLENIQSNAISREKEKITNFAPKHVWNVESPSFELIKNKPTIGEKDKIINFVTKQDDDDAFWNIRNHDLEKISSDSMSMSEEKEQITEEFYNDNHIKNDNYDDLIAELSELKLCNIDEPQYKENAEVNTNYKETDETNIYDNKLKNVDIDQGTGSSYSDQKVHNVREIIKEKEIVSKPKTQNKQQINTVYHMEDVDIDLEAAIPDLPKDDIVFLLDFPSATPVCKYGDKVPPSEIPESIINATDVFGIFVTEVHNPYRFWFHYNDESSQLDDLMKNLEDYYTNLTQNELQLQHACARPGQICAALFCNLWHRAEILDTPKEGKVKVFFMDYGTVSMVSLHHIKYLMNEYSQLKSQALRGSLAHIKPKGHRWSRDATYAFLAMVSDKYLFAKRVEIRHKDKIVAMIQVDTNGDEDIQINDALVRKGHARLPLDRACLSIYEELPPDKEKHFQEFHPNFEVLEKGKYPSFYEIGVLLSKGIDVEALQDSNIIPGIDSTIEEITEDHNKFPISKELKNGTDVDNNLQYNDLNNTEKILIKDVNPVTNIKSMNNPFLDTIDETVLISNEVHPLNTVNHIAEINEVQPSPPVYAPNTPIVYNNYGNFYNTFQTSLENFNVPYHNNMVFTPNVNGNMPILQTTFEQFNMFPNFRPLGPPPGFETFNRH